MQDISKYESVKAQPRCSRRPTGIIVGAGYFGRHWLSILSRRQDCSVKGIVAADQLSLQGALASGGPERGYTDLTAAIEEIRPDFAIVAVPEMAHREVVCTLLDAGVDCLCEKPIATTWEDACAIGNVRKRNSDRVFMINQQFRWRPTIQTLRAALTDGRIGTLREISIVHRQAIGRTTVGAWRERMEHPYLFDMAVHFFDLFRYLSGNNAESVCAHAYGADGTMFSGAPSLSASVTMKGGIEAHVAGTFVARGFETQQEGMITLSGERGTLLLERSGVVAVSDGERIETVPLAKLEEGDCDTSLSHFLAARKTGRPPSTSFEENLPTFAMVIAAERSHRERRRVAIEEVTGS